MGWQGACPSAENAYALENKNGWKWRIRMKEGQKQFARKSPDWLKQSVIYQIFPRAFTKEGTLNAAEKHLPDIAKLGADIIYLCPIFLQDDDMREEYWSVRQKSCGLKNPKNPYRIKDYYSLDPEYGSDSDLHSFVCAVHGSGMRILLDMVYLHCGPAAVFMEERPDFVDRNEKGDLLCGEWHFPTLNFKNQDLREYLWKNMEYWITEFGVDGFRCDVAFEVPLDFWEEARERLEKIKPDVIMLSEGETRFDEQLKAFDLNYNFSFTAALREVFSGKALAPTLQELWKKMKDERPVGTRFIRYIDNHDLACDDGKMRLEKQWERKAVEAALLFIFTADGTPFLYNGQEIADDSYHSIFGYFHIDWNKAGTQKGKERFEFCQTLCRIYHEGKALTDGELVWLENETPEKVISFLRKNEDEEMLVVINATGENIETQLKLESRNSEGFKSLIKQGVSFIDCKHGVLSLTLEGFACLLAKPGRCHSVVEMASMPKK
jgi:glycosidase